jgi:diguanylate cyclase (GGDEF)-like protein
VPAASAAPAGLDVVAIDPLVEESRRRPSSLLSRREAAVSMALAASYLIAAVALPLAAGAPFADIASPTGLLFLAAYALVSRIEFEIGTGSSVPTVVVLVPMLFVLPPALAPLIVLAAYLVAAVPDVAAGELRPRRLPVLVSTCWHAVGPAAVLAVWGSRTPRWSDVPLYALALAAQFGLDLGSSLIREAAFGVTARDVLRFLRPVFLVDTLLFPVALTATFEIVAEPAALLGVLPLAALLWVFARERHERIEQAVALSRAYAGARDTALHDELTGLLNRRGWDEAFDARQASAAEEPTSLIVVDVDGLKQANDGHGHEAGDALIRAVGRAIAAAVRAEDVVARLGGDEFAALLPGASDAACAGVVERIERLLGRQHVPGVVVSASIGRATVTDGGDLRRALRRADERMYEAKAAARPSARVPAERRSRSRRA